MVQITSSIVLQQEKEIAELKVKLQELHLQVDQVKKESAKVNDEK
jgi:hypothetical protein